MRTNLTTSRPLAAIGILAIAGATIALLGSPPGVRAAEHAVQIGDSAFGPTTLTVAVGDTVTWTNADSSPHTASAEDGAFDSGNLDTGQTFSFTFTAPGTYAYRCDYHSEMTATVVVEAAAAEATAAPAAPSASAAPAAGGQPDTALPAPAVTSALAPLLIGLGLLAIAIGLLPARVRREAPARMGGWRR